jgi:protein required for attachment to host cells
MATSAAMANDITWILIADAGRARLFASRGRNEPWRAIGEFTHPRSSAKVRDLMSDKSGRIQQRVGGSRSAADPRTPPKEVEAERFAHQLAAELHDGLERGACHRLLLVAPPRFLGLLRQAATPAVRAAITASVDHDWTQVAVRDLPARLANEIGRP